MGETSAPDVVVAYTLTHTLSLSPSLSHTRVWSPLQSTVVYNDETIGHRFKSCVLPKVLPGLPHVLLVVSWTSVPISFRLPPPPTVGVVFQSVYTPPLFCRKSETGSYCVGDGRGKVDPRLANVVRYRLGRKESHAMAAGVLEEFISPAPAPPAPPAPPATATEAAEQVQGGEKENTAEEGRKE